MKRLSWALGAAATAAIAITCSQGDGALPPPAIQGSGAASATGSGSGGTIATPDCDPPCRGTQFCSATGKCIDEGTCADDGDCELGAECTEAGVCTGCNPPNLLIDLDRSCSMKGAVGGSTKWEVAVDAIHQLTTDYQNQIRFGLTLFPDRVDPSCQQDAIPIPVGDGSEGAIQQLLTDALVAGDPNYPDGPCITNIDTAMEQAASEPSFDDTERESYVLLITDGKQYGCNAAGGDAGTTQIITDLYQQRGIPTFVVGFGAGVDPAQLNVFADAGGVPTNDTSCSPACRFYKAEDAATLEAALDAIAKQVSCGGVIE